MERVVALSIPVSAPSYYDRLLGVGREYVEMVFFQEGVVCSRLN
jgi:hypothetical protein